MPPAQGCFEHIGHAIDSYTWGISWFGFAILMWTVRGGSLRARWGVGVGAGLERPSPDCLLIQLPVMLIAMYFYTTL